MIILYPFAAAIAASPIPVFPDVFSIIVEPGLSFPSLSACSIISFAILSFTDPAGLKYWIAFAKAGATVVLVDINEPKEQAEKLVSEGYKAVAYRCDVSDTRAVKEMIDWIVATYGRLDAALNNAGIQTPQRPMAEITDEEFDRTVAVDLKGVWNCMRYEIIQMLKQGGGAIVNTSSQGGVTGFPGQAAYIACKHAVIGLTRTAAIDYSAKGIRINAVCPGVIRTPMAEELIRRNPDLEKELVRDIPAGRLGKPEEIANAVLWLCSPQASFVDGHALLVDGAFSIH